MADNDTPLSDVPEPATPDNPKNPPAEEPTTSPDLPYDPEEAVEANIPHVLPSFLIPPVGLILWLCWRHCKPDRAQRCGRAAITGVVVYIVILLLWLVLRMILWNALR
jgi:hypothetical protein